MHVTIEITNRNPDPEWFAGPWFAICEPACRLGQPAWFDGFDTMTDAIARALSHAAAKHPGYVVRLELNEQLDLLDA